MELALGGDAKQALVDALGGYTYDDLDAVVDFVNNKVDRPKKPLHFNV